MLLRFPNVNKAMAEKRIKLFEKGELQYCWNPDCAGASGFQWCHVLSSKSQLGIYGNNKPLVFQSHMGMQLGNKQTDFISRSKRRCLVFRGFCNDCDNKLFQELDDAATLTHRLSCEQALRAAAYNHYNKTLDFEVKKFGLRLQGISTNEAAPLGELDPRLGENIEEEYRYFSNGLEVFRDDCLNYARMTSVVFKLSKDPEFRGSVCTGLTTLPFGGNQYIDLNDTIAAPYVSVSVLEIRKKTYLIFNFPKVVKKFADNYIEHFMERRIGSFSQDLHAFYCNNNLGLTFPNNVFLGRELINMLPGLRLF